LEGRVENEVRYYDPHLGPSVFGKNTGEQVPHPYGAWHLEAMDSHGAWLASATDLVRFACAFDSPDDCPLLSADSVKGMFERPAGLAGHDEGGQAKKKYYGLGWSIQIDDDGQMIAGHGGSLPGTNTQLVRRGNGRNYAILFNSRLTPHTTRIAGAALPKINAAIEKVETWPTHDLFND
jgi:N-acyl-D-amino-acid deacylase